MNNKVTQMAQKYNLKEEQYTSSVYGTKAQHVTKSVNTALFHPPNAVHQVYAAKQPHAYAVR
jgi:hypothetical protein